MARTPKDDSPADKYFHHVVEKTGKNNYEVEEVIAENPEVTVSEAIEKLTKVKKT